MLPSMLVMLDDPSVALLFSQQTGNSTPPTSKLYTPPHATAVHACVAKCSRRVRKLYKAHSSKQLLRLETLGISWTSIVLPSSARLVLQRISNIRDGVAICSPVIVGRGLLVAVYVDPLIAGQDADGSVAGVGEIVRVGPNCVTVTGALSACIIVAGVSLFPVIVVGVSLGTNKVALLVSKYTMTRNELTWTYSTYAAILHQVPRQWL